MTVLFNLVGVDSLLLAAKEWDCNPNLRFGSKSHSIPHLLAARELIL